MKKNQTELPVIDDFDAAQLLNYLSSQDGSTPEWEAHARMLLDIKGVSIDSKARPDGRWQARVNENGKQKSFYGKSPEEVRFKVQQYLRGEKLPTKRKKSVRYKTREWLEKYFELYKSENRIRTKKDQQKYIEVICATFGETDLNKLNELELQKFFNDLNGSRYRELIYNFFNAALEKAYNTRHEGKRLMQYNPLKGVMFKRHKQKERPPLSASMKPLFVNAIKGHKYELRLLLMLESGLRPAEALAIDYTDLDLLTRMVRVNKSIAEDGLTKTEQSVRLAPMPPYLAANLHLPLRESISVTGLAQAFRKIIHKIAIDDGKAYDWTGIVPYSLRHTASTEWDERGVPKEIIAIWLGNSENVTATFYIHKREQYGITLENWENVIKFDTKIDTKNGENALKLL